MQMAGQGCCAPVRAAHLPPPEPPPPAVFPDGAPSSTPGHLPWGPFSSERLGALPWCCVRPRQSLHVLTRLSPQTAHFRAPGPGLGYENEMAFDYPVTQ